MQMNLEVQLQSLHLKAVDNICKKMM